MIIPYFKIKNYFIPKAFPTAPSISLSRIYLVFPQPSAFSITFNCSFVTADHLKNS
jgi:hypothetical protein